ncbi:PiggyBac transposable element-derived protein 4 [Cucumispora dikerogammari]|nr:PiggyBac transposable element-derived protein 4 [Cucumispora dikerogammari]
MRMRRDEPEQYIKDKELMNKNDFKCAQKGGINILQWYDKKVVCFLSTFLNIEEGVRDANKIHSKPNIIRDYDQNIGGVDIYDQMIKSYYNERKSVKWTNKLAIYLINMMLHNSFILYKMFYTRQNKIKDQVTYRKTVI